MPHSLSAFRLRVTAAGQWLLVLPATVFIAAAGLRELQPRQYEPARTSWMIVDWSAAHLSRWGAAAFFIGLPAIVLAIGGLTLRSLWQWDQRLRQEALAGLASVRRHLAVCFLGSATLVACVVLAIVLTHVIAD